MSKPPTIASVNINLHWGAQEWGLDCARCDWSWDIAASNPSLGILAQVAEAHLAEAHPAADEGAVLTLAQGIDTLPTANDQYLDWMRRHGLGHAAGVGAVISAVRQDLRQLPGGTA
ncbi:hypothetical protein [Paractinoplanes maris]|uniref:hypothetical protein n=1 Tax=Paractinoplanes maris TaxID=1734446 RepID=UPI0020203390|nr:hypothetical protein [Actinoplanes maris]